jgi:hypothetical protein
MFAPLQAEIAARFTGVESYFRATKNFKGDLASTAKGLMFVQVYAVYEFSVNSVVRAAIDSINAHNHKMKDISPSLMALFLDPELHSLRDISRNKVWDSRLKFFERVFSNDFAALPNTTRPPTDGSHYRHTHLQMICRVFGINRLPVPRRRHFTRIDEVVDNRNAIAHGEETADQVGRRYTRSDILHMTRQMKSVCVLLVSIFDSFCADRSLHRRR